tara:strand:+ start:183 stop:425 length:243 start_codon:yes stop_codon:yes gene_type:complete
MESLFYFRKQFFFTLSREIWNLYYRIKFSIGDTVYQQTCFNGPKPPGFISAIKRSGCGHLGATVNCGKEVYWVNFSALTK